MPPTEVAFEADENQIRQIVWNLATNGLRAMRDGGRLTLGARVDPGGDEAHESVVLEVSDEGVGIPAEELDAIFQPFRGTFSKGTGLGLAIVHRIVSDYGGEIQVSSTPGNGHDGQCEAAGEGCRGNGVTKNEKRRTNRADVPLNKELANAEPGTRNPEPGTPVQARSFSSSTTSDRCASCCRSCCGAKGTT